MCKSLMLRIYKQLLTTKVLKKVLNNEKTNNSIKKWAKDVNTHFSKKNIETANKHMERSSTPWVTAAAAAAKSPQSCLTLCNPIDGSPPGSPSRWDSPGKNAGVGCHFLLQCMKVKSESEVAQLCWTLSIPVDCSLSGSPIPGILQARVLELGASAFSDHESLENYKPKPQWAITSSPPGWPRFFKR